MSGPLSRAARNGDRSGNRGRRYAAAVDRRPSPGTLYLALAEPVPAAEVVGQTRTTKAKETVDDDVEALLLETLEVA